MHKFDFHNPTKTNIANIYFNHIPSVNCPYCDALTTPLFLDGVYYSNDKTFTMTAICPSCLKVFLIDGSYEHCPSDYNCPNRFNKVIKVYPSNVKYSHFDEHIKNLSSRFVSIYDQALTAESLGLNEIYGIGYRKALEFLVKDYLISKKPADKDAISNKKLSDAINMLTDENAKNFAHACRILGNDNTHYLEDFTKDDLSDIKSLVDYIATFISNDQKYIDIMTKKANNQNS